MHDTEATYVTCTCCGAMIEDTPAENVNHGNEGRLDAGYGECRSCGGDDRVRLGKHPTEEQWRKKLGFSRCVMVDARIEVLRRGLNEQNRARFESMHYGGKAVAIFKLMEQGLLR